MNFSQENLPNSPWEDGIENVELETIESTFPLCDGSLYVESWRRQFDANWLKANGSKFKKAKSRRAALESQRSEAFLRLIQPAIGQSSFDFPVIINEQVLKWIHYFQTKGRRGFVTWLRRAQDVVPHMLPVLQKYGLPEDLVYLAMIESGFSNRAISVAKAVGPWQFMRATGKEYGLRIDDFVDERRDPRKATEAAARYLTDLYQKFGDWHLSAASYNAGMGRVQRALNRVNVTSYAKSSMSNKHVFFHLAGSGRLPTETSHYVPKLIAAMVIGKSPSRFGFDVASGSRALKTELVYLQKPIHLKDLAAEIGVDMRILQNLNPELRHTITPPPSPNRDVYPLRVPSSIKTQALAALEKLPDVPLTTLVATRSLRRETLQQFSKRMGVNLASLLKANPRITAKSTLYSGQTIHIPVTLGTGQYDRVTSDQRRKAKTAIWKKRVFAAKKVKIARKRLKK